MLTDFSGRQDIARENLLDTGKRGSKRVKSKTEVASILHGKEEQILVINSLWKLQIVV